MFWSLKKPKRTGSWKKQKRLGPWKKKDLVPELVEGHQSLSTVFQSGTLRQAQGPKEVGPEEVEPEESELVTPYWACRAVLSLPKGTDLAAPHWACRRALTLCAALSLSRRTELAEVKWSKFKPKTTTFSPFHPYTQEKDRGRMDVHIAMFR